MPEGLTWPHQSPLSCMPAPQSATTHPCTPASLRLGSRAYRLSWNLCASTPSGAAGKLCRKSPRSAAVPRPELSALGVGFVSLSDSLDLTTPAGRALAGMLSVFANFERDLIVERVRGGMEHAKRHGTRSGRPIGRPPTIAKREIEIRALTNAGVSIAEIARRLKIAGTAAR